jgi:hypothetical protein
LASCFLVAEPCAVRKAPQPRCGRTRRPGVHPGGLLHPRPVFVGHGKNDRASLSGGEPAVAASDLQTRGQPLHVPLPWAGQGSSKSLMSNIICRSGEANTPKFDRCASPQTWTCRPERGGGQVRGHDQRGAPVKRERRYQHPAVTDRNQLGDAGYGLLLGQPDRVGSVGGRLPAAMAGPGNLITRRLSPRHTLPRSQVRDLACHTSTGRATASLRGSESSVEVLPSVTTSDMFFASICSVP